MSIVVTGVNKAVLTLTRLGKVMKEVSPEIDRQAKGIKDAAAKYPPPRGYQRTGKLGRGWEVEEQKLKATSLIQQIYNDVAYAKKVQGQGSQSPIHEGYWQTDEDVALQYEKEIELAVLDQIDRILSG